MLNNNYVNIIIIWLFAVDNDFVESVYKTNLIKLFGIYNHDI